MTSRVRALALDLRIPAVNRDRAEEVRREVEEVFVTGVLNALESRIHARLGTDAIVRVRELRVAWTLRRRQLSDAGYAERLGHELAADLEAALAAPSDRPPSSSAGLVLFEDEAHLTAARLTAAAADEADGWLYAGAGHDTDAWAAACAGGGRWLATVLAHLGRMGSIGDVLARLDRRQIARGLDVLPAEAWPEGAKPALAAAIALAADGGTHADDEGGAPAAVFGAVPEAAETGRDEGRPPARGGARMTAGTGRAGSGSEPPVQPRRLPHPPPRDRTAPPDEATGATKGARPSAASTPPASDRGAPAVSPPRAEAGQPSLAAARTAPAGSASPDAHSSPGTRQGGREVAAPLPEKASCAVHGTRFAGLFYLLNPVLALELPEILWCAGVAEGAVLGEAARLLLGEDGEGDPAPAILAGTGGAGGAPAAAVLPAWAAAEIASKARAALGSYLAGCGRALLADERAQAIAAIAATLPAPAGSDPLAIATTITDVAAILLHAFGARLGERLDRIGFVERIRIGGRIECDPPTIRVVMPMDAIDIRLRLAGLDFDPGYLPWLKQRLVFVFEERAADA